MLTANRRGLQSVEMLECRPSRKAVLATEPPVDRVEIDAVLQWLDTFRPLWRSRV